MFRRYVSSRQIANLTPHFWQRHRADTTCFHIGLWYSRHTWTPYVIRFVPSAVYTRLPQSFTEDIEAGLSSDNFNLHGNLQDDGRSGLDANSKREILKIMKSKKVSFDDARTLFLQKRMAKNGIGPDGRPLDPRAVFFS